MNIASFDTVLTNIISSINTWFWSYLLVIMLVGVGLYFSIKTGFVQGVFLNQIPRILRGNTNEKRQNEKLSSFEAFCISTGARIGVGNIAGIAIAIMTGGPGAIFWMWITAIIGASSGFVESALAQLYKRPTLNGKGFWGGPAFYITYGLKAPFWGVVFALLLAVSDGLIFNSVLGNTLALSIESTTGTPRWIAGILIASFAAWVAFAGAPRLARFSARVVPMMVIVYCLLACGVAIVHIERIPLVLADIIQAAFDWHAVFGAGLWFVLMTGVRRGLYSHEAGQGTVPNASAAAECAHPVDQGLVQSFGVYIDTLVVCSASAMIILLTPDWASKGSTGIELVQQCLAGSLGLWSHWVLFAMVLFFALTSIIGNFFYSEMSLRITQCRVQWIYAFRLAVIAMVFIGSQLSLSLVWNLADLFMGLMVLINLIAIIRLYPKVAILLSDYRKQLKAGQTPRFQKTTLPPKEQSGVVAWD